MAEEDQRELGYRRRLKDSLKLFASDCLRIRTKSGSIDPLVFNRAQQVLHAKLEEQRNRHGRVRALILKGRQQGCSTYVQARFYHRVTHGFGLRAYILTHEDEATKNIFEIAKRYHEKNLPQVTPHTAASNARELIFDKLDSGYRVATAGKQDTGRSATFQFFHGSEVAFWPHAETHASGAMQAVPPDPGTEVILESTSNGPRGLFHDKWKQAAEGEGDYEPIFIPWFWQPEYRSPVPEGFDLNADEIDYQQRYDLDLEQLAWRRSKILELFGVWHFRREYPATPDEAFKAESPGALWKREWHESNRIQWTHIPQMRRMAISLDPATTSNKTSDEWGIIWGGIGHNGHGYIMGDESRVMSPDAAGRIAVKLYKEHKMEMMIYEANQGGDMIPTIIKSIDKNVTCVGVSVHRGKRVRAEPVAALYEQGQVHHVGVLTGLEDEQCTWNAARENESPNRIDACCQLLTKLMLGPGASTGRSVGAGDEMERGY